jgi:hypothetical protein
MKKYGIKNIYFNEENYIESPNSNNFRNDSFFYEITDPVRYYSKNFWTQIDGIPTHASNLRNIDSMFTVEQKDDSTIVLHANKKHFMVEKINNKGLLETNFNEEAWQKFVEDSINSINKEHFDLYFNFFSPVVVDKEQKTSADKNENYIKSDFHFNFFHQKFEQKSSSQLFETLMIPDVFTFLSDKRVDVKTFNENLKLSLGGLIETAYVDSLYLSNKVNESIIQYYNSFADAYDEAVMTPVVVSTITDNVNVIIDEQTNSNLKNVKFLPFPNYVDIKFSNPASEPASLIHNLDDKNNIQLDLLHSLRVELDPGQSYFISGDDSSKKFLSHYDLKDFISSKMSGTLNIGTADGVRLMNDRDRLYHQVEYTKLINYIKQNIKIKTRKYNEIFTKPCHSEVLVLKVMKKQFGFDREPIQTFWIVPDKSDYLRFIDTQIKYSSEYYYDIVAYTLVVGNAYKYSFYDYSNKELEKINDIKNGIYKLKVSNNSIYKIIELPFAEISGNITENPYTKPQISISKEHSDIRISLMQPETESLEEFDIIENRDFDIFQKIVSSQGRKDNKILSKINTSGEAFLEIYKTINRPTNHLSFQNKLYKTILFKTENSFLESIVPNIKYYYAFRYLNKHNIPSNISDIYEVEMKDEDGYLYLNVQKYDLKRKQEKSRFKNLKRYLLIRPSLIQTQPILKEKYGTVDNVNLGPGEDPVWDKDFILRIISKKTNRVLEFNLKSTIFRKKD